MSLGVGIGTSSGSSSTASSPTTVSVSATWTQRNDASGYYLAEEITGLSKCEFGPMAQNFVPLMLAQRTAWWNLQMARLRALAVAQQAYCIRQGYAS